MLMKESVHSSCSHPDWLLRRGIQHGIANLESGALVILLWGDNKTTTPKQLVLKWYKSCVNNMKVKVCQPRGSVF